MEKRKHVKPFIFFDFDGTIVDSMDLCVQGVLKAMRHLGLPEPPIALCEACNGPTFEETVPMLGIPPERAGEYYAVRTAAEDELCEAINKPYPGVGDMLRALSGKAELCIVSNGQRSYIDQCIALFGFEGLFSHIEGSRPGRTKTQALQEMLDALRPERAVMVGDRLGDLMAGKACGLPTVAACYGFGTPEEWDVATWGARDMQEMQRVLEAWVNDTLLPASAP